MHGSACGTNRGDRIVLRDAPDPIRVQPDRCVASAHRSTLSRVLLTCALGALQCCARRGPVNRGFAFLMRGNSSTACFDNAAFASLA